MTLTKSSALQSLLLEIRQHPAFPEMLKMVPEPRLSRFRRSSATKPDEAFAQWAYESGALNQHELWLANLTGTDLTEKED